MTTGIEELDRDLEALEKLNSPEKIEQINDCVKRIDDITIGEIFSIIGKQALQIASALSDEELYERLITSVVPSAVAKVEESKTFVEKYLRPILESKVFSENIESKTDNFFPFAESMNVISTVSGRSNWLIQEGEVIPAIRYVFANHKRKKIFLDSTLDWDDVLFVAGRLLDNLDEDIKSIHILLSQEVKDKLPISHESLLKRLDTIDEISASIKSSLGNL